MRYIGSKARMLDNIQEVISRYTRNVRTVTDIFAGTGVVSRYFKESGYTVFSNDILYFSYVINRGVMGMNEPVPARLHSIIHYLNNLKVADCPWFEIENAFIYQNYSPHGNCSRMYFQCENALKIDLIRQGIEQFRNQITEAEYFYLLALLINAVPYVSNITGTYGAYLKYWDKRTYNSLTLEEIEIRPGVAGCRFFNMDAASLAGEVASDLMYLDPPYNGRQYLPNYHILETIARYDYPEIKGVTGVRIDPTRMSDFCRKAKAEDAFRKLFGSLECRYILLSYNNEGLLSTETMSHLMQEAGNADTFRLVECDYRRYKNKIPNNKAGLKEQLYFVEKQ